MNMQAKTSKKHPHGYCAQIADIVGTDRFYVSKILRNPERYNGQLAEQVKQAAQTIDSNNEKIKAALLTSQSQNTLV